MKTEFVTADGSVAIPTTDYPGDVSPGAVIDHFGKRFVVNSTAHTKRVTTSIGQQWVRVVLVQPETVAVAAPAKVSASKKPKSVVKEQV